jgi:hypothetical protein
MGNNPNFDAFSFCLIIYIQSSTTYLKYNIGFISSYSSYLCSLKFNHGLVYFPVSKKKRKLILNGFVCLFVCLPNVICELMVCVCVVFNFPNVTVYRSKRDTGSSYLLSCVLGRLRLGGSQLKIRWRKCLVRHHVNQQVAKLRGRMTEELQLQANPSKKVYDSPSLQNKHGCGSLCLSS